MIVIGRGRPPQWVWVSAARVQRVRALLAVTGLAVIGVLMAWLGAFWALLSGLSLLSAMSCAQGEHVDVNGARLVRRLLMVLGGVAFFAAGNIPGRSRV